jgi:hypothetical protein
MARSTEMPIAIGMIANARFGIEAAAKLPMRQNTMAGSLRFASAVYVRYETSEEKNALLVQDPSTQTNICTGATR